VTELVWEYQVCVLVALGVRQVVQCRDCCCPTLCVASSWLLAAWLLACLVERVSGALTCGFYTIVCVQALLCP